MMKQRKRSFLRRQALFLRLYVVVLLTILSLSVTALLSQTAFANTYVITDGDRVVTYTTFATDPEAVLEQAGMPLRQMDSFTTQPGPEGETITVSRGQEITIQYHGQTIETASPGETAGELLARLELAVSGEDVVSPGMDTPTYDGMELRVDRVETLRQSYTCTMPHSVSYCRDASLPAGTEEVLTAGVDGELLQTADITYVNGREVSRSVLEETVLRPAVAEIIGQGASQPEESRLPRITEDYIYLPTGEVLTYTHTQTLRATAYTHTDDGCGLTTATGTDVRWGTVAVDPRYIPYGTRMFVLASDGSYVYGIATAEDCGGDIKGDRMDLYMPTYEQCIQFGRRPCTVYFLA